MPRSRDIQQTTGFICFSNYSNHLNTEHLKTRFIIFKWQYIIMAIRNIIMVTTQPSHSNSGLFCPVLGCHSKIRPFANWTTFDHLNTELARYSDGYCITFVLLTKKSKQDLIEKALTKFLSTLRVCVKYEVAFSSCQDIILYQLTYVISQC